MPPVVLEIRVDADQGMAELRAFDKTLQTSTKATQQHTQTQNQAAQSHQSFSASLGQSVKAAAGLAAGFAGVAGIATTFSAAATAATGFEAALNAINALGTVSASQLTTLRNQLLALPPALGSSTELAKGLYDILGANVPAENAITVLTRSAELAKGGLGNLDTAINAVTKSAAAFGIPLDQAQYVTDVFTQTVVRGQGRLEEFAAAFPQVAATASATGASFIDTNAAIAVLTQTFKNADTAATGLNSFFQQLIQNSAKFAAEGINVKQVLSEEGLTGLFRRLQEVTGGSAERMKELINDSEGFRAALTLTGTQFQTFNETVGSYANVTGLAQQAASKNLAGAGAAWQTFLNTLDRLVQEVAPPLLAAFTSIASVATTLAGDITKLWRAFSESEFLTQLTADFQEFFRIIGDTSAITALRDSMKEVTGSAGDTYDVLVVFDELLKGNVRPAIDFVTAGWDLLNAAFNYTVAGIIKLGQYLVDGLVRPLSQVVSAMDQVATTFGLSDGRFSQLGETTAQLSKDLEEASAIFQQMAEEYVLGTNRMVTAQQENAKQSAATTTAAKQQQAATQANAQASTQAAQSTTQLSTAQKTLQESFTKANDAATGLKAALEKLKVGDVIKAIPTAELERSVATVITQLKTMEESGKFSARQISQAYEDAAAVMQERFGVLPAAFQAAFDGMRAAASTSADGIQLAFERLGVASRATLQQTAREALADFEAIRASGQATPETLLQVWQDIVEQIDRAGFQKLPEGFQAANQAMQDIARRAGVDLPRPYVNAFGEIELAGKKAFETIDVSALNSRGALERAGQAVESLEGSIKGLSDTAVRLGHTLNEVGEEVNAYGNTIARTSDETQKLRDLQISAEMKFADDVHGLMEQLNKARVEMFNYLGSAIAIAQGSPGEYEYRVKTYQKIIAALQAKLLDLGYDEFGRPLSDKEGKGGTPSRTSPGSTTTSPPGTVATSPTRPTSIASTSGPVVGQVGATTYNVVIQTQAQDAAALARDLVPYLRESDLTRRSL